MQHHPTGYTILRVMSFSRKAFTKSPKDGMAAHELRKEEGPRNTKDRDKRKAELCQRNRVELVYFRYDEDISKRMVIQRLKPYLNA